MKYSSVVLTVLTLFLFLFGCAKAKPLSNIGTGNNFNTGSGLDDDDGKVTASPTPTPSASPSPTPSSSPSPTPSASPSPTPSTSPSPSPSVSPSPSPSPTVYLLPTVEGSNFHFGNIPFANVQTLVGTVKVDLSGVSSPNISGFGANSTNPSIITLSAGSCEGNISNECVLSVWANPVNVGNYSATLTFSMNLGNNRVGNGSFNLDFKSYHPLMVLGSIDGQNAPGKIRVLNAITHQFLWDYSPFGNGFNGGVRVALADFNGDGISDIILAPGKLYNNYNSGARIIIMDGTKNPGSNYPGHLSDDYVFSSGETQGLYVAAGKLFFGDSNNYLVVGGGLTGTVRVLRRSTNPLTPQSLEMIKDIKPYSSPGFNFNHEVRVAVGDVNGSGYQQIITVPGPGGAPRVRILNAGGSDTYGNVAYPGILVYNESTNTTFQQADFILPFVNMSYNGSFVTAVDLALNGRASLVFSSGIGSYAKTQIYGYDSQGLIANWSSFGGANSFATAGMGQLMCLKSDGTSPFFAYYTGGSSYTSYGYDTAIFNNELWGYAAIDR